MSALKICGIDLSNYQGGVPINWAQAKAAGVQFVYHKATEGDAFIDPFYEKRRAEAKANGVRFGAYHFARPTPGSAVAEAKHFLAVAKPQPGDMLPVLDLEVNSNMSQAELSTWAHTFIYTVRKTLGLKRMVLYTQFDLIGKFAAFLWVPRYSDWNGAPRIPAPFSGYAIWQFSDGKYGVPNHVPGIPTSVDINTLAFSFRGPFLRRLLIPGK